MADLQSTLDSFRKFTEKKKYNTIYADPPWQFQNRTGKVAPEPRRLMRYETMTLEEIKALYHARWGIESAFRELKYGLGLVNLHGKKCKFVQQEIYAAMIMANFSSRIAGQVVVQKRPAAAYA